MNKEELFKQFINEHASEEYTSLVQTLTDIAYKDKSEAAFQLSELADYLHTHRTPSSVATAIHDLARKEAKAAERKARVEEQRNKQVADPLAAKEKSAEPAIKEEADNTFMCMCFIPTDVKQAIQDEMERRAENDPALKAFLPNVSYTDIFNRIASKLQQLAKSAPRAGGVAAVHFSDADTYALAEFLIRNQLTEAEKKEQEQKKAKATKENKSEKPKPKKEEKADKVVPMIPAAAATTKEAAAQQPKEKYIQLSLFDD